MRCLYINFSLWLFALLLLGQTSCSSLKYSYTTSQLPFKTIGTIPIINGRINGKSAVFIVDTGASVSILNESLSEYFGFWRSSNSNADSQNVVGLGGESDFREAYNCKVELGALVVRGVVFRTNPLTNLARIIKMREQVIIAGIIGSDVLNRYKVSIDYHHNTISFQSLMRVTKTYPPVTNEPGFLNLPY